MSSPRRRIETDVMKYGNTHLMDLGYVDNDFGQIANMKPVGCTYLPTGAVLMGFATAPKTDFPSSTRNTAVDSLSILS
ncbi:hypothetical protein TWF281_010164 [Arthrobotrys megalospora]